MNAVRQAGLAALLLTTSAQAHAQAAVALADGSAETAIDNATDEIIVSARRREESLQDVPVAITALSGDAVEQKGLRAVEDLRQVVAGLNIGAQRRDDAAFYLRGQGPGVFNPGQRNFTSVATYFAEVPTEVTGAGMFYDLANVQVLKGPQGTLFGRNTTGGAVLFEPARPDFTLSGYVKVALGNYANREAEAVLNLPIIDDRLAIRLSGTLARRDGFTQSVRTGQKLDGRHYEGWRVSVLARPVDGLENMLILDGRSKDQSSTSAVLRQVNPALPVGQGMAALLAEQAALGPRKTLIGLPLYDRGAVFGVTNKTTLELTDNLTLKNIISFRRNRTDRGSDYDGTPFNTFLIENIVPLREWSLGLEQFTEEFQLQGKVPSIGLTYLAGFYYEHATPGFAQELRQAVFGNLSIRNFNSKDHSTALFAHGELGITDQLQLSGGFRYTWDRREASISVYSAAGACTQRVPPGTGPITCPFAAKGNYKAPSYDATLQYTFSPDGLAYAAFRHGYKSGGLNLPSPADQFTRFQPEYVDEFEFGLKADWNIGVPLRTNLAVFHDKYKDIQISSPVVVPGAGIISLVQNVASATNNGVEFEATLRPLPGLTLGGFVSYLDSASNVTVPGTAAIAGRQTAFQPKWKYGINGQLVVPAGQAGEFALSADFSHTGTAMSFETNPALLTTYPGYGLLNLRAELREIGGSGLDIALFASNVTNKTYLLGGIPLAGVLGFESALYGEPRMYGLSLKYRFGSR